MPVLRLQFFACLAVLWALSGPAIPLYSQSSTYLEAGFRRPPPSARPHTFWFWMNGNVTRDGITRDLEAMQRAGIGGVLIFDGGTYLPKGPVDYMSPVWREMMTHAVKEADRLGLEVAMHNGPGWSSSGGPWITPERSMQQLAWTEITVSGPQRLEVALPQPYTREGYYRDAFVLAFPSVAGEGQPYQERLKNVTTGKGAPVDKAALTDGSLGASVPLGPRDYLQFEFAVTFEARALTAFSSATGRLPSLSLEASDDGVTFRKVVDIRNPGSRGIQIPSIQNFPPVRARFFRLVASGSAELAEVVLHRAPRIEGWTYKANFAYRVGRQVELPADPDSEFAIDPASVRDITARLGRQGQLSWDVPAGAWTILRLGHTSTGQRNASASEAGRGLESDKLSRQATEFHFQNVLAKVIADAGPLAGKSFVGAAIDSYEAGMQNWTASFPEEFRKRNGYDLRSYLPAMTGRIVGDAGISERFLFDLRRTQAELMAEYYYGRMAELCREHGLKFYIEAYGPGPFDELQVGGLADFPMTEFWERTPWTPNRVVKSVSSAAHIYGKPVVAAESFTGEEQTARWLEYPYSLKTLGDLMFSLGLNQMVFHRYAHQPHPSAVPGMAMGPWGFHFDRTNTWFDQSSAWLGYLARSQYLLRQGTYAADVLYFVGERPPDAANFTIPTLPAGYNYDLVNAEVLLSRAEIHDGRIVLPDGASYRLLALPEGLKGITPDLLRKLRDLVAQGLTLLGPKPEFSLTLRGYPAADAEVRRVADELWGGAEANRAGGHVYGKGRVSAGQSLADVVRQTGVEPDFQFSSRKPDASLSWLHRRLADSDIYFVANRHRRSEDVVCTFRVAERQPELWRPETGEIRRAAVYALEDGRVRVPLHLDPAESLFVVFRSSPASRPAQWLAKDGAKVIQAQPFSVSPAASGKIENTFTISVWAKPDTDLRLMPRESTQGRIDETGKNYLVPAPEGDALYGKGHAAAGIAAGRNGIYVVERSSGSSPAVLVANIPLSGWTHLAVVYRSGKPRLYVNGKFVREGLASGSVVHPGVGAPPDPGAVYFFDALDALWRASGRPPASAQGIVYYFEGNMTQPEVFNEALADERVLELASRKMPPPEDTPEAELSLRQDGKVEALLWRTGSYSLDNGASAKAVVAKPAEISGPWQVTFPAGLGAPSAVTLPELMSLHKHTDPGVKYFSGTATYTHSLAIPAASLARGRRVYLDLGRVEVLAEVRVNGRNLGILWKEPYRVEVTDAVHRGANTLEIRVTGLWPNRLIGDEHLPPENQYGTSGRGILRLPEWYVKGEPKPAGGRTTFSTWQFYTKDAPLLESGLLGPVRVLNPVRRILGE